MFVTRFFLAYNSSPSLQEGFRKVNAHYPDDEPEIVEVWGLQFRPDGDGLYVHERSGRINDYPDYIRKPDELCQAQFRSVGPLNPKVKKGMYWLEFGSGMVNELNGPHGPGFFRQLWHLFFPPPKLTEIVATGDDLRGAATTFDSIASGKVQPEE